MPFSSLTFFYSAVIQIYFPLWEYEKDIYIYIYIHMAVEEENNVALNAFCSSL
jgi:hypothetical protein